MGTLVLSLDAELGWGFHHVDPPGDRIERARDAWRRLVDVFDEYDVPTTWAVVGHLFEDQCEEAHLGHPGGEHVCESSAGDLPAKRAWFGGELVERVLTADVDHEIAGHGFTHVHFDHDAISRAGASREVRRTREAAAEWGIDVSTFVFPVNEVNYRQLLVDGDITCYRGRTPTSAGGDTVRRARKATGALVDRGTPPVVTPHRDEYGLVNVPASMYLFDDVGPLRPVVHRLHGDPVVRRAVRGLDAVAGSEGTLHLWFHPHNLTEERDFDRLRAVLATAARHRDRGDLSIETMGDVAARVPREGAA